jgi:hypothetical protein
VILRVDAALNKSGFDSTITGTKKSKAAQRRNTMTQTSATQQGNKQAADENAIRPLDVNVPGAN